MIEDLMSDCVDMWKDQQNHKQDQEDLENFWWCNEEEIREEE